MHSYCVNTCAYSVLREASYTLLNGLSLYINVNDPWISINASQAANQFLHTVNTLINKLEKENTTGFYAVIGVVGAEDCQVAAL